MTYVVIHWGPRNARTFRKGGALVANAYDAEHFADFFAALRACKGDEQVMEYRSDTNDVLFLPGQD